MYPHERSLVEKYRDEPFAILGVNSDEDLDELKPVVPQVLVVELAEALGLCRILPDGRRWEPVVSAFRYAQAFHFGSYTMVVEPVADGQPGVQKVREQPVRIDPDHELEVAAVPAGRVGHRERPCPPGCRAG